MAELVWQFALVVPGRGDISDLISSSSARSVLAPLWCCSDRNLQPLDSLCRPSKSNTASKEGLDAEAGTPLSGANTDAVHVNPESYVYARQWHGT